MNAGDFSREAMTAPFARKQDFPFRPILLSATRKERRVELLQVLAGLVVLHGVIFLFAGVSIDRLLMGMALTLVVVWCHLVYSRYLFEKPLADTVMLHEDALYVTRNRLRTQIPLTSIYSVEYRYFKFGYYAVVVLYKLPGQANELLFSPAHDVRRSAHGSPIVDDLLRAVQAAKLEQQAAGGDASPEFRL